VSASDVRALAAEVSALSPALRLRLAADLLDRAASLPPEQKLKVAHTARTIAECVSTELGAAIALYEASGGRL
jgi:hypothetical protein